MTTKYHIVFVWELGSNYGHITKDKVLAHRLLQLGCEVSFVLRDLSNVYRLGLNEKINLYQAPILQGANQAVEEINNFSDILLSIGYANAGQLNSVLKAWLNLIGQLNPDLLVCDHAPTGLIAAKLLGINSVNYGTGFEIPEISEPMPSLQPWKLVDNEVLHRSDLYLLSQIKTALSNTLPSSLVCSLQSLLKADYNFLCTLPEIDPYLGRNKMPYWGPIAEKHQGIIPVWPKEIDSKKVFIYLRSDLKINALLLKVLIELDASVVVHFISGMMPENLIQKFSTIYFSHAAFNMQEIYNQADLIICHGGHGMVSGALLNAIPLLILPTQQEQKNTAYRLSRLGVAQELNGREKKLELKNKVKTLLNDRLFKDNIEVISKKYQDFNQLNQVNQIAEHCIELCKIE